MIKMYEEHKKEIEEELFQEMKEEPIRVWIKENINSLEQEFIEGYPPEDKPLDDDIPDFLDLHSDEFDEFCKEVYYQDGRL